tara:strand:+ start:3883 stop:5406 length:1524 start_codon:yes stop_codon:yes gene_type:complete
MCGIFAFLKNNTKISDEKLKVCGLKCSHRGPDSTKDITYEINNYKLYLMFHRLAINGLTELGDQPLTLNNKVLICNGEIYNYKKLAEQYELTLPEGCSDCEVILHLYQKVGIYETISNLDGVFSFVLFDFNNNKLFVGHDPIGVRSLYYFTDNGFGFASEMKCLTDLSSNVKMFPPGTYLQYELYKDFEFVNYFKFDFPTINDSEETIVSNLKKKLTEAVDKRLMSEKPIGCLLSGGFDSSLITALSVKKIKNLKTFSIGLPDSPDILAAQKVAEYLNTDHISIILTEEEMLNGIEETIKQIESYDITTIRASTPMFLLSKYIRDNTDIKVILSGEGADETSGSYLYFHNAPNSEEFKKETIRLVKENQYFDILRADKTTAGTGLEIRVPFYDKELVKYYMSINPKLKMVRNGYEKYLLRKTFESELPNDISWRRKDGFSDGVSKKSKPWYETINDYTTSNFNMNEKDYYKNIFDKYYPNRDNAIPYYWMPKWSGNLDNPSNRLIVE